MIQKLIFNRDKTQNGLLFKNKESSTPDSQLLKVKQKNPQIIWGLSLEETNLKNLVLAKNIKSSLADSYKGLSEMENPIQNRIRSFELMLPVNLLFHKLRFTHYTETLPNTP